MVAYLRGSASAVWRDVREAPTAVRGALIAVGVTGVPAVLLAGATAHLGLGPVGDATAALLLLAVNAATLGAVALLTGAVVRLRAMTHALLVAAAVVAIARTLDPVMPLAFATIYLAALFGMVAWLGAALGLLRAGRGRYRFAVVHAALAVGASAGVVLWLASAGTRGDEHDDVAIATSATALDPGVPGPFRVRHVTYGSGTPQRRALYASMTDLRSRTVDMRPVLPGFSGWKARLHARYWGFTQQQAPLNGQVWMPDGAGPFPVVVIMHGQHSQAAPSEEGFAYLAELLATRGFIAVGVDATFLNGPWIGGHMHEIPARAWIIDQHLALLAEWTADSESPLHAMADLERIAVVGHSRGGEAALLAARHVEAQMRVENASVFVKTRFDIDAVVALAPTDRVRVRHAGAIRDVSYLVLQGAQDADVASFQGAAAYNELEIGPGGSAFKAALYVAGANHSGFNSAWREHDVPAPLSWLLNRRSVMKRDEQQRFAVFFTSAFLEATLHGNAAYRALLREPLRAAPLLPPHRFAGHYHDPSLLLVDTFEEDLDLSTTTIAGGQHAAWNLKVWEEQELLLRDRFDTPQGNTALHLAWDGADGNASYEIHVPGNIAEDVASDALLVLSIAVVSDTADLTLELVSGNGARAALPLSRFTQMRPVVTQPLWKIGLVEDFMFRRPEVVLQTVEIPLAAFEAANPQFDGETIDVVRLVFDRVPAGEILLDDVGFRPGLTPPDPPPPF